MLSFPQLRAGLLLTLLLALALTPASGQSPTTSSVGTFHSCIDFACSVSCSLVEFQLNNCETGSVCSATPSQFTVALWVSGGNVTATCYAASPDADCSAATTGTFVYAVNRCYTSSAGGSFVYQIEPGGINSAQRLDLEIIERELWIVLLPTALASFVTLSFIVLRYGWTVGFVLERKLLVVGFGTTVVMLWKFLFQLLLLSVIMLRAQIGGSEFKLLGDSAPNTRTFGLFLWFVALPSFAMIQLRPELNRYRGVPEPSFRVAQCYVLAALGFECQSSACTRSLQTRSPLPRSSVCCSCVFRVCRVSFSQYRCDERQRRPDRGSASHHVRRSWIRILRDDLGSPAIRVGVAQDAQIRPE